MGYLCAAERKKLLKEKQTLQCAQNIFNANVLYPVNFSLFIRSSQRIAATSCYGPLGWEVACGKDSGWQLPPVGGGYERLRVGTLWNPMPCHCRGGGPRMPTVGQPRVGQSWAIGAMVLGWTPAGGWGDHGSEQYTAHEHNGGNVLIRLNRPTVGGNGGYCFPPQVGVPLWRPKKSR